MKAKILLLGCLILVYALLTSSVNADDDKKNNTTAFSFALIGDTPYAVLPGASDAAFNALRDEINANDALRFVLHAGDIKSGSTLCSDEMFNDRYARYSQFEKPFILTLGDNEWTDCHRLKAGGFQPLERLAKLRKIFFSETGKTLAKPMRVMSQARDKNFSEFVENVMWRRANVMFATAHIVGSENALEAFDPAGGAERTSANDEEVQRRTAAAIQWMNQAFDQAEQNKMAGVFLMIHANPKLEYKWLLQRDANGAVNRLGFNEFLFALSARIKAFAKPVVLAHGDSHWFRIDKPELPAKAGVADEFLPNFTRVESFGASSIAWIEVKVNPASKDVFQFEQHLVTKP